MHLLIYLLMYTYVALVEWKQKSVQNAFLHVTFDDHICIAQYTHTHTHTHTRLMALFLGLPG